MEANHKIGCVGGHIYVGHKADNQEDNTRAKLVVGAWPAQAKPSLLWVAIYIYLLLIALARVTNVT